MRGKAEDWIGLPKSKSLFWAKVNTGLPIGNLTSQLFGNVYLDDFDHFIKHQLQCQYYGRYVDDIVIVHSNKEYLKSVIPLIRQYLQEELSLELHPRKICLQSYVKGVAFLGSILKPYRQYIGVRSKSSFYKKIKCWNQILINGKLRSRKRYQEKFICCMNSYLGLFKCFNTYKLRKKMLEKQLCPNFKEFTNFTADYGRIEKSKLN